MPSGSLRKKMWKYAPASIVQLNTLLSLHLRPHTSLNKQKRLRNCETRTIQSSSIDEVYKTKHLCFVVCIFLYEIFIKNRTNKETKAQIIEYWTAFVKQNSSHGPRSMMEDADLIQFFPYTTRRHRKLCRVEVYEKRCENMRLQVSFNWTHYSRFICDLILL